MLSAYSTSPQGELLVSTFIGAMHPDHPMAAASHVEAPLEGLRRDYHVAPVDPAIAA